MSTQPTTLRGMRTRAKLLRAAEDVFSKYGYHEASIVKITEAAEVGQGTFYLYFDSKAEIFDELVEDMNRRVRHAMSEASSRGRTRIESERLGFRGYFDFIAANPTIYRIIRQAEFVSPAAMRLHYTRIAEGYIAGLDRAKADGDIAEIDSSVAAWALMGMGELVGMRWVLWENNTAIPDKIFEQAMLLIDRALDARHIRQAKQEGA